MSINSSVRFWGGCSRSVWCYAARSNQINHELRYTLRCVRFQVQHEIERVLAAHGVPVEVRALDHLLLSVRELQQVRSTWCIVCVYVGLSVGLFVPQYLSSCVLRVTLSVYSTFGTIVWTMQVTCNATRGVVH